MTSPAEGPFAPIIQGASGAHYDLANRGIDLRKTGVYCITHVPSGRIYIGSTATSFRYRWQKHLTALRAGVHHSSYLQRAYTKHGEAEFEFSVMEVAEPADCTSAEQWHLDRCRPYDHSRGFNILPNARSARGYRHTPEAIEKTAAANRGRRLSAEHRERLSRAHMGKTLSESHRRSLSAAGKGKPRPRGAQNGKAKLTEGQVRDIWNQIQLGLPILAIARSVGRSWWCVKSIKTGRTWGWLTSSMEPSPC